MPAEAPGLPDRVKGRMHTRHVSLGAEQAYLEWILRHI